MPAQILTPAQEAWIAGLIDAGVYRSKSEVLRASLEAARHGMPAPTRMDAALHAYKLGKVTISLAARLAEMPYGEMKQALKDHGLLRLGLDRRTSKAMASKAAGELQGSKPVEWPES